MTRLVSFLGTGRYTPVRYVLGGHHVDTRFVGHAVAKLASVDEIHILATPEAETTHAQDFFAYLRDEGLPEPRLHSIPSGATEGELWHLFRTVLSALGADDDERVILDITHGFRVQPFFSAAAVLYHRATAENSPDMEVLYGAFDARDNSTDPPTAPIWNLTSFLDVANWAIDLAFFLETGRAKRIPNTVESTGRELAKAWARGPRDTPRPQLDSLARALRDFSDHLGSVRTGSLVLGEGNKASSANRLLGELDAARSLVEAHLPPLSPVFDRVRALVSPLAGASAAGGPDTRTSHLATEKGLAALKSLALLYRDLDRPLEAAATVREALLTAYASPSAARPGYPDFDMKAREAAEESAQRRDEKLALRVGQLRNDLLHAGYRPDPQAPGRIADDLAELARRLPDHPHREEEVARPASSSGFANITNHPVHSWPAPQLTEAKRYGGEVYDLPFPEVPPEADLHDIERLADKTAGKIAEGTTHALVMGEFTLSFALVRKLQARGVVCLAASSPRDVREAAADKRISAYNFTRLREYPSLSRLI